MSKNVTDSESDFSEDVSEFEMSDESISSSNDENENDSDVDGDADEPKTPRKTRKPIIVPVLPKTPSVRQSTRTKRSNEFIPESDGYFQSHSSSKIQTSDHTLDRLKNPRLTADKIFTLLSELKLPTEHEKAIEAMMQEYRTYFPKWMWLLNEGFNILLNGLGSKRQLLQAFHQEILIHQTVLVINGFFPSLTLKDILDSILCDILEMSSSPANPHEAVNIIEEELSLLPETHLFLIIHNLDGPMLRNSKAQDTIARLAKVPNIHLIASIDHINAPLCRFFSIQVNFI